MNTNRNNGNSKNTCTEPAAAHDLGWEDALVQLVADPARFMADRDVVALASYIKARFGGTAVQAAANKDVLWSVQFKNDQGEVVRKVVVVVMFAKGEYYTRFKVMVTANKTRRDYLPCSLDDAIQILQDTANPFHYSNRIYAAAAVKEKADAQEPADA